jgi:hypothetical protein
MRLHNRGPLTHHNPTRDSYVTRTHECTPLTGLDHHPDRFKDLYFRLACENWLKVCYYETLSDKVAHATTFSTYSPEARRAFVCTTPDACVLALSRAILTDDTALTLRVDQAHGRVGQPTVVARAYPRTVAALRVAVGAAGGVGGAGRVGGADGAVGGAVEGVGGAVTDTSTDDGGRGLAVVAGGYVALAHWAVVDSSLGDPMQLVDQACDVSLSCFNI